MTGGRSLFSAAFRGLPAELRLSARCLVRRPLFAASAAATLTIAVGFNVAVFSLLNAIWLRPPAVRDPSRLVLLYQQLDSPSRDALSEVFRYSEVGRLTEVSALTGVAVELAAGGLTGEFNPRLALGDTQLHAVGVSPDYFEVVGVRIKGRSFSQEDDRQGAAPVAVISEAIWRREFGGQESIIGRQVAFGSSSVVVVGVALERFAGPLMDQPADLWLPMAMVPRFAPIGRYDVLPIAPVRVYGRIRNDATISQAETMLGTMLGRRVKGIPLADASYSLRVQGEVARDRRLVGLLFASVTLVLVLGCVNLATLFLARAEERKHEVAMRVVVGASRIGLARLLLTEAAVLCLASFLGALAVAPASVGIVRGFALPSGLPLASLDWGLDWRVIGFAGLASVATGMVAAVGPAMSLARADLAQLLISTTGSGRVFRRSGRLLLAAQAALSVVLLVQALMLVRSVHHAMTTDLGFDADRTIGVLLQPALSQYADASGEVDLERRRQDVEEALRRLRALPGVVDATTGPLPLREPRVGPGQQATAEGALLPVRLRVDNVGAHYLRTSGITLLAGRDIADLDLVTGTATVVVVSQGAASRLWPNQSAVGKRLSICGKEGTEVVGVVTDAVRYGLRDTLRPVVYCPAPVSADLARPMFQLIIRSSGDADQTVGAVSRVFRELFPSASQLSVSTARARAAREMARERFGATLFGCFGVAALIISLLGAYGLVAYLTAQRVRQSAIRLALGATSRRLFSDVVVQSLLPVAVGTALGLWGAWLLAGSIRVYLFGVDRLDPVSLALVAGIQLLAAAAAIAVGARRLGRVEAAALLRRDT